MDKRSFENRICDIRFCRPCALSALAQWKGWPIRDAVPRLPMIHNGKCPVCHGTEELISTSIEWHNVHGQYNTGLPDYWVLQVNNRKSFEKTFPSKWGLPYYEIRKCERCGETILTSIFNPPIGWELRQQCMNCNFIAVSEGR